MDRRPWERTPAFTEQRLRLIAAVFDEVRKDLVELHEPEKGDGNWSLGCRAYERTCFALSKLAEDPANSSWLKVEFDKLACTLRLESVPVKFYRGDPDDPTPRALRGGVAAALRDVSRGQTSLLARFGAAAPDDGWFWLIAIDTHVDGSVARVVVFQATESGETRDAWEVPLEGPVAAIAEVSSIQREGVDLPPPPVGAKQPTGEDEISAKGEPAAEPEVAADDTGAS